ncbi:MAG TPA: RNA 2',3'-cyclic phosphodiesterase [Candidatus Saccharimonadales bacterium]|nr:RNA 2',3'-cyclic phosphodiesterase [Candidatus Saccharimonadales bacterium]
MRLFVAIEIPLDIRNALASFIRELRAIAPQVKWVRAENLHVTLKFLGHTDDANVAAIENALSAVRSADPVSLAFHGLGFFPNEKRPRVFWAGMQASGNLKKIAADIDHAAHTLGFPLEERPFAPHLTLARFDPPGIQAKFASTIAENSNRDFGSMTARHFHLIQSNLKSTGAEYTALRSFPFAAET